MTQTRDLVPRRVPIIGLPHEVAAALDAQVRNGTMVSTPDDIEVRKLDHGRVAVYATMLTQRPPRKDSTFTDIGKALAFVITLAVIPIVFFALAWLALSRAGIDWASVGGLVAVGVVVMLLIVNRSNHSGACPGAAVHCKGCKG